MGNRAKKKHVEEDPLSPDIFVKKKKHSDECRTSNVTEMDADEQFLLSCLPALKRLRPRDNAIARMRIQQVLFDVEFGEEEQSEEVVTKVEEDD